MYFLPLLWRGSARGILGADRTQSPERPPKRAFIHQRNWPVADVSADLISALATGTHLDIAATDQIRPIATTTPIPIPVRICIPLCVALSPATSG